MRKINRIIIHATASMEGKEQTVEQIREMHIKQRHFKDIGYHFVIYLDGSIHEGRPLEKMGAHCKGFNADSIGISYVGGTDKNGKPKDTRTDAQKKALIELVTILKKEYLTAEIKGHRDYSPDLNKDGKIERWEWIKACPCFEVSNEF